MHQKHSNIIQAWSHPFKQMWHQYRCQRWSHLTGLRFLYGNDQLPPFVQQCPLTMRTIRWLRLLDWQSLCQQPQKRWFGQDPVPLATYIATFLVKLDQGIRTEPRLRQFLLEHPALVWSLGFPLTAANTPHSFDPHVALPTHRHFSHVLRQLPNQILQTLLDAQVKQLQNLFPESFGETISLDTKHIVAWVKENNPKAYIKEGRYDKHQQPTGDRDCKLGCKRRHNRVVVTPTKEGFPAIGLSVSMGEFYWGYASGVVATKVADWGEFVLAEMTQTFDKGDTHYFFPLMDQVEKRLGFRPRYGALDAAFDAFYVYDYFHSPDHDGFAAIPFSEKGGKPNRQFDEAGMPLCDAGLTMSLKFIYTDNTTAIIPYRRTKFVCPLLHPQPNGCACPVNHQKWLKGGCTTTLADSPGSRLRHQLNRDSDRYKTVYSQRTAVERLFSQALELGIERPKLRNQPAITNQNTLIYLLINLRAIQRLQQKQLLLSD